MSQRRRYITWTMPESSAEMTRARWNSGLPGGLSVSLGTCTYTEVKIGAPKSAELRTTKPRGGVHAHHEALAWSQAEGVIHTSPHAHLGMPAGMEHALCLGPCQRFVMCMSTTRPMRNGRLAYFWCACRPRAALEHLCWVVRESNLSCSLSIYLRFTPKLARALVYRDMNSSRSEPLSFVSRRGLVRT